MERIHSGKTNFGREENRFPDAICSKTTGFLRGGNAGEIRKRLMDTGLQDESGVVKKIENMATQKKSL